MSSPTEQRLEDKWQYASQWQLMRVKFRRHKLARIGLWILGLLYAAAAVAEFLAPHPPDRMIGQYSYAPPQKLHWFDKAADGTWSLRPHVYGYDVSVHPVSMKRDFAIDPQEKIYVRFFGKSEPYKLANLIPMHHRLMAVESDQDPFFLLGADRLGRDLFSRLVYAGRVSLSIGLLGVAFTLVIGVAIGGISGYFGGFIDNAIQRFIELLRSIPTIPIWLALTAALPAEWSPLTRYFLVTLILAVVGWTEMARVVRSRFMSLRREDYVTGARLDGSSSARTIVVHMIPSFTSHLLAATSLAVPQMILAETALSFLGLGLQPPTVSWGVLLQEAQNIRTVSLAPWLLLPGVTVVLCVLAMNAVGDGLRDAADPYHEKGIAL